jgi:hypothetical protein
MNFPGWDLETPVVLLIFNRPDTTRLVFDAIRAVRPRRLLVVADGPRSERKEDKIYCQEARAVIDSVDWDCDVDKNYSDENLGCMQRVSSGLDWAFRLVDEAIILEDDCLPHPSFFPFCQELLGRFRDEPRIAQISGVNFQFGQQRSPHSYYFSRYNHIWGWASWKRAWELNDNEMTHWPIFRENNFLDNVLSGKNEVAYWTDVLNRVYSGEIDTWDCRWTFSCWQNELLTVIPEFNLISNIGFRPDATHTPVPNRYAAMKTEGMKFPMHHPSSIVANYDADSFTGKNMFSGSSRIRRLVAAVRGLI